MHVRGIQAHVMCIVYDVSNPLSIDKVRIVFVWIQLRLLAFLTMLLTIVAVLCLDNPILVASNAAHGPRRAAETCCVGRQQV